MSNRPTLAALTGAAGALLVGVGMITFPDTGDGPPIADAERAAQVYSDDSGQIVTSNIVILLGVAALLWFAASMRTIISDRVGERSVLPSAAFAGGVGGSACLAMMAIASLTMALRSDEVAVSPDVVAAFDDFSTYLFGLGAPVCFSALVAATALAAFRSGSIIPKAPAGVSIVLAMLMVAGPIAFIGMLLFLLWLVGVSLVVGLSRSEHPTPTVDERVPVGV